MQLAAVSSDNAGRVYDSRTEIREYGCIQTEIKTSRCARYIRFTHDMFFCHGIVECIVL